MLHKYVVISCEKLEEKTHWVLLPFKGYAYDMKVLLLL